MFIVFYHYFPGTHWIFEILSMLFNGNTESIPHGKSNVMLEAFPQSTIDEFPSPRVLNSHLPLHMLPMEMKGHVSSYLFGQIHGRACTAPLININSRDRGRHLT